MVADAALGHPELSNDVTDGMRPVQQKANDAQTGRIAKPAHELRQQLAAKCSARRRTPGSSCRTHDI
jgi:hypothetical protein